MSRKRRIEEEATGRFNPLKEARRAAAGLPVRVNPGHFLPEDYATVAGTARPSSPQSVFAEDFSLLIRTPRRLRLARTKIYVLS